VWLVAATLLCLAIPLMPAARASAADSSLDPSFGDHGRVVGPHETFGGNSTDVAVDSAGRVLLGTTVPEHAVLRYTASGKPDPSFGDGGAASAKVDVGGGMRSMTLDPSGRILVAGFTSPGGGSANGWLIVRFTPDGQRDPTFGSGGVIRTLGQTSFDKASDVVVDPAGRVVVVGTTFVPTTSGALATVVRRYLPDGTLDPSFGGGDGEVTLPVAHPVDTIVDPAGRIVILRTDYINITLSRLTPSGQLDPTFGANGDVPLTLGHKQQPAALTRDAAGRLIVQGSVALGKSEKGLLALTRVSDNGSVDRGFGDHGRVLTALRGKPFAFGGDVAIGHVFVVAEQHDGALAPAEVRQGRPQRVPVVDASSTTASWVGAAW